MVNIYYTTIPAEFIKKYKLPDYTDIAREVERVRKEAAKKAAENILPDNCLHDAIEDLYVTLYNEKKNNFQQYYNTLNEKYSLPANKCLDFAQKIAVWTHIIKYYKRSSNSRLEMLFEAYSKVFPKHFGCKRSLSTFMKLCRRYGVTETAIDLRSVKKVQKRISKFQAAFIQTLYIQSPPLGAKAIHAKLERACAENGEKPYSRKSVLNYMNTLKNNLELYELRYGQAAAQKQAPYASLLPAEHINTQWQMDGKTLAFWGGKFKKFILYSVFDNHSRKVIGYSIGKSENTALILEALDNAIANTGVLPAEIVSDKHSFTKTDIAKGFKTKYEAMGGIWTVTTNAQHNQIAERNNQYYDAISTDLRGFIGKGMTAISKDARPSPEALAELAKPKNWATDDELKANAVYIIHTYNHSPLTPLHGLTPNQAYDASHSAKAFTITEAERIKLLRPAKAYKVIRGQINIMIGIAKHEFQLPAELIRLYNNKQVLVMYEDLTQGIYLYDMKTFDAIGSIEPKQKMHGAIADQTEQDRKLLHQQAGRKKGTQVQARKAAQQTIAEALKDNPEAIDLINSYTLPKDIRRIAQQDSELKKQLREMGVNENMLPIRTTANPVHVPADNAGKTKDSPFMPAKNDIRILTPAEIYGTNESE